ncbi:uncharacterized protein SPAPADRAFT_57873 [Spathaspora passalidarum NRRL Y-27907]|uniref:Uncharacterized protein n=1 Tax=Spathaspora passalidarum (strain NRRL Y-27907 / 11-Y1) TaxID=619300 RepID=G3AEZ8_SPAPN|nr:uncharacterized protein SPAPADRAFT_57873 [Spathaspora passalidarum NRRL Y-27907]EGW34802.1 hypothetical protein SPAPADRAFT_57873 [Spathaspora passalidarum NRRL Y-27907]
MVTDSSDTELDSEDDEEFMKSYVRIEEAVDCINSLRNFCLNSSVMNDMFPREIIVPAFSSLTKEWNPFKNKRRRHPHGLLEFISFYSFEEAGPFKKIMIEVFEKYKHSIDFENKDSFWFSKSSPNREDLTRLDDWMRVFKIYLPDQAKSLYSVFARSAVSYLETIDFTKLDKAKHKIECYQNVAKILTKSDHAKLVQFKILNPWIHTLIDLHSTNTESVPSFYSFWYTYFSKDRTDTVRWYLNKAILLIQSDFPDTPLPNYNGHANATYTQLFLESTQVNVQGVSSYQLHTSFKDVVEQYCLNNGILMKLSNLRHLRNMRQLYNLTNGKGGKAWAYIEDDVLWITNDEDFEYVEYEPVALEDIESYL